MQQLSKEAVNLEKYGPVVREVFSNSWLCDFPQVFQHIESEHLLHIRGSDNRGEGMHWQTNKFAWSLNPLYNPEAKVGDHPKGGFQMKLGYFIIPLAHIKKSFPTFLSPKVLKEFEIRNSLNELCGFRFFVHPEAYDHFKALHEANIPFVKPQDSAYIGTPTSSYRSWTLRHVEKKDGNYVPCQDTVPFIVKLGVMELSNNTGRLLSSSIIENSLKMQNLFDKMDRSNFSKQAPGFDMLLFKEGLGLSLKNISNYPPCCPFNLESIDSGLIVREFPEDLLEGRCKIFSFSAVMSLERLKRENRGVCSLENDKGGLAALPLIYEMIQITIKKGLVKSPFQFVRKYLIENFFEALENIVFKNGLSLAAHGQNLCLVLNSDNTPRGFAYRDFEGIGQEGKMFLETGSWFGRFHILVKLLSVITRLGADIFDNDLLGAPSQIGGIFRERSLYDYLKDYLGHEENFETIQFLQELSLGGHTDSKWLLNIYDDKYLQLLSKYFDLKKAGISPDGGGNYFSAAESGSAGESRLVELNCNLWQHRTHPIEHS